MSRDRKWWTIIGAISFLAVIIICCVGVVAFIFGLEAGLTLAGTASPEGAIIEEAPAPEGSIAEGPLAPQEPFAEAAALPRVGESREHPTPFGEPVVDDRGMEVTVLKLERNVPSESATPGEGKEFIRITVKLHHLGTTPEPLSYDASQFQVIGQKDVFYQGPVPVSTGNDLEGGQLQPGQEKVGKIVMEVGLTEGGLVLSWDGGAGVRWLSLQ